MSLKNETQEETRRSLYIYFLCPTCGVKLHMGAHWCWKCGNEADWNANKKNDDGTVGGCEARTAHGSENPEDSIYCTRMNNPEICMTCKNTQLGRTCAYFYCFDTGRGKCDVCEKTPRSPFACCQERQRIKEEDPPEAIVKRMLRNKKFKGKPPDEGFILTLTRAVKKEQEDRRRKKR